MNININHFKMIFLFILYFQLILTVSTSSSTEIQDLHLEISQKTREIEEIKVILKGLHEQVLKHKEIHIENNKINTILNEINQILSKQPISQHDSIQKQKFSKEPTEKSVFYESLSENNILPTTFEESILSITDINDKGQYAVGLSNGMIYIISKTDNSIIDSINTNLKFGINVLIYIKSDMIIYSGQDNTLYIYSIVNKSVLHSLIHSGPVQSAIYLKENTIVSACSGRDHKIFSWNIRTGKEEFILKAHSKPVNSLIRISDDQFISTSYDKTIRTWLYSSRSEVKAKRISESDIITCASLLNSSLLVVGTKTGRINVYNIVSLDKVAVIKSIHETTYGINSISTYSGGNIIVAYENNSIKLFSFDYDTLKYSLKEGEIQHNQRINIMIITSNGEIYSGSDDKTVKRIQFNK